MSTGPRTLDVYETVADRRLFMATVLAMVVAFAPVPLPVASGRAIFVVFAAVFGGLLLAAYRSRAVGTTWLATLLVLWAATAASFPAWSWPWAAMPAVLVVLFLARDERGGWLGRHRGDLAASLLAVTGLVVMLPLLIWWLANIGRTDLYVQMFAWQLRGVPGWLLPIVGLGFAAGNSLIEELLFRGIVQETLRSWIGPAYAIAVQGIGFGLVHWVGIPGGLFGIAMTTIVGVLLGVIRHRTRSILLPWLLHLAGNLAAFTWIAVMLR